MDSKKISWNVTNARTAAALEDKLEHILKALEATAISMREIESKVNTILERR